MTVLNKHHGNIPKDAVYIGRGSKWGNPFSHFRVSAAKYRAATRKEACEKHAEYLQAQIHAGEITLAELAELHGKDLVCFCAPKQCHGDTLTAWGSTSP